MTNSKDFYITSLITCDCVLLYRCHKLQNSFHVRNLVFIMPFKIYASHDFKFLYKFSIIQLGGTKSVVLPPLPHRPAKLRIIKSFFKKF